MIRNLSMAVAVVVALLATVIAAAAGPKKIKKLDVTVSADGRERNGTIASLDMGGYDIPGKVSLKVTDAASGAVCPSQWETACDGNSVLYWQVPGKMAADESRRFVIEQQWESDEFATGYHMEVVRDAAGLTVTQDGKNVFRYNTAMAVLPHGADPSFSRNGYIHPAWSPAGNVLTTVSPDDHLHHYGIWNPWTSVDYDGGHYDLWNIGEKTGTVCFDSLYSVSSGELFADILVRHRHIIFQPQAEQVINTVQSLVKITPKKEVVIMDEMLDMRAWRRDEGTFVWDFNSELAPSTALPVLLKAYRYAGFGWRATADWTAENCEMFTSEGKRRPEIDGTNARWIYVTGMSPKGRSGILFMACPENHNFPEPLRIWDRNANGGRGDAFINFAPTKNEDWTLHPGSSYRLRYRMMMFDGDITPERAEAAWADYAYPVRVTVN